MPLQQRPRPLQLLIGLLRLKLQHIHPILQLSLLLLRLCLRAGVLRLEGVVGFLVEVYFFGEDVTLHFLGLGEGG